MPQAVRWDLVDGAWQITPLYVDGIPASWAEDINTAGTIVGTAGIGGTWRAVIWMNDVAMTLPDLGGAASAEAINDAGQIVGWAEPPWDSEAEALFIAAINARAVRWERGSEWQLTLLELPDSITAEAHDINAAGQIVGTAQTGDGDRAFLWQDGVTTYLDDLLPAGAPWRVLEADAINDAGQIVGRAHNMQTDRWEPVLIELEQVDTAEIGWQARRR